MSSASIRDALRGARAALVACQAGWEEAVRQRDAYSASGVEMSPTQVLAHERMERTVAGQQLAVAELERMADLREPLNRAVKDTLFEVTMRGHGWQWQAARIAERLGL